MGKKKIKFQEMKTELEVFKVCYSLWKISIDEYKSKQIDSYARTIIAEAMKYRWYHCRLTGEISLDIYDDLNDERREEWKILYFAALTHDIKKFDHKHSKVGAMWIKDNIKNVLEVDDDIVDDIVSLVRYHKSSLNSETVEVGIGKRLDEVFRILKLADNLSKIREKEFI